MRPGPNRRGATDHHTADHQDARGCAPPRRAVGIAVLWAPLSHRLLPDRRTRWHFCGLEPAPPGWACRSYRRSAAQALPLAPALQSHGHRRSAAQALPLAPALQPRGTTARSGAQPRSSSPVAALVLLARPAPAGVVAARLVPVDAALLHHRRWGANRLRILRVCRCLSARGAGCRSRQRLGAGRHARSAGVADAPTAGG